MTREKLLKGIKEVIKERFEFILDGDVEIKEESVLSTDFGLDSIDTVELIMETESKFGVFIPDSETEEIKTVGDLITVALRYIDKKQ